MSKYRSQKVVVNGIRFDSKKEARRYCYLAMRQQTGEIKDLQRQVKYVLIPSQREPDITGVRGGIKKGKLLERECAYYADFQYYDLAADEFVVEDTKGVRTEAYKIKRKLMLYVHGIKVKEI